MKNNYSRAGALFVLPFFLGFVLFQLYPIIYSLYLSFQDFDGFSSPKFTGLDNFATLFRDSVFWDSLGNTWQIWGPNIISQLALALAVAYILTNTAIRIKGVSFFRAVFYLPNLITAASIALLFSILLDWQNGAINQLLFNDRENYINWMGSGVRFQAIVSFIQTWLWFGNTAIILMAGMLGVPNTLYESARIDGAGNFRVFRSITLPLIRPIMLYVGITSLIGGMQLFDIPYILSLLNNPENAGRTIISYIYNLAFRYNRFGYAAAASYLLFMLLTILSIITFRLFNTKD